MAASTAKRQLYEMFVRDHVGTRVRIIVYPTKNGMNINPTMPALKS